MSTTTTLRPAVRAAFDDLIDYAGLFPPAELPMDEALAEYATARAGAAAWMLGRFIVPASRVAEAAGIQRAYDGSQTLPISVIAQVSPDARQWFDSVAESLAEIAGLREAGNDLRVRAIEVPLAKPSSARETFDAPIGQLGALIDRAGLRDLPVYVELPREALGRGLLDGGMTALARTRLSAKLRCGGVCADAFPTVEDVTAFVAAAAGEGVAFKATAGLHHPVRHRDRATGAMMHGFLNLLAAAALSGRLATAELAQVVAEEDAGAFAFDDSTFAWRTHRVTLDELRAVRNSLFAGYGSCSFTEPVEDLAALGLIPAAQPAT